MDANTVIQDAVGDVTDGALAVHDQEPMECAAQPAECGTLAPAQQLLLSRAPLAYESDEAFA